MTALTTPTSSKGLTMAQIDSDSRLKTYPLSSLFHRKH